MISSLDWPKTSISHRCQYLSNIFPVDWPAPPLQLSSTFAPFHPVGNFHQNIWDTLNNHLTSTLQDPVTRSSCLDFYQLVLFFTTAGAAVLRAVGVQLLIFVKAVKRNEKEGRPIKAGSKWTAILLHVNHIWMSILDQNKLYNVLLCCNQDSLHCIMSSSWFERPFAHFLVTHFPNVSLTHKSQIYVQCTLYIIQYP